MVSNVWVWVWVCVGKTDASIYTLVYVVCTCSWLVMFISGGGGGVLRRQMPVSNVFLCLGLCVLRRQVPEISNVWVCFCVGNAGACG